MLTPYWAHPVLTLAMIPTESLPMTEMTAFIMNPFTVGLAECTAEWLEMQVLRTKKGRLLKPPARLPVGSCLQSPLSELVELLLIEVISKVFNSEEWKKRHSGFILTLGYPT